jgi:hypothetical protein
MDRIHISIISFEVFMPKLNKNIWALAENILPWLMLAFLGYFTLAFFVIMPYTGVYIDARKTVTNVYGPDQGENSFMQNDIIQRIGPITYRIRRRIRPRAILKIYSQETRSRLWWSARVSKNCSIILSQKKQMRN